MTLISDISAHLELGTGDVARFLAAAPARYKSFPIPKRRGGERTISQPSSMLKDIQRYVLARVLDSAPVHPCATAYVKGKSIAYNATAHRRGRIFLKLDFKDFFPSITVKAWRNYVDQMPIPGLSGDDFSVLEYILFWGDGGFTPKCLSIGAPTSPHVSNMVMYPFDAEVAEMCRASGVVYTRYADDITLSGRSNEDLLAVERRIQGLVKTMRFPRLTLNQAKRGLYGPGERRMVTGLVITPERQVSIGRERKRVISAMIHHAAVGQLDVVGWNRLRGLFGFVAATEPEFITRMRRKYGDGMIDKILRFNDLRHD